MQKLFIGPAVVSAVGLFAMYLWGGAEALLLTAALSVLEVTLSFDNAVVNAKVLERMTPVWQRRFLTWGMLVSVIGVRLILPIFIVSAIAFVSPWALALLALHDPAAYAALVATSAPAIDSFGGMFLLLVALRYFFDGEKEIHWIHGIERHFVRWAKVEAMSIILALTLLMSVSMLAGEHGFLVLKSGIVGIIVFMLIEGLTSLLGNEAGVSARAGLALFMYINVLDAAFSLDGVIGAFALTSLIPVIVVGLGIGAYFVRTLTIMLVRGGTLRKLIYLEHGAHWAIFALAGCMLVSLFVEVPEWLTAFTGFVLILLSYFSSRRTVRRS